ncbi:MAG: NAD(P)-dependent alcohol dehydrogenase [Isosphaerales bacterium]
MKAIVILGYGGSDQLNARERPDPTPGAGEILVRVRAAGVNPVDWKIRRGDLRLFLRVRFPYVPGGDVAGEVVELGPDARRFKPGDAVFAFVDMARGGGYAELAVVKEAAAALKPQSLSFTEAASLPIAACTALQGLRDVGGLRQGGSTLINGGAGGVGHFAVQIAKALGATTAATCGPFNVAFVESLGADLVIDYSREDFTQRAERYDVVFDAVAMSSFGACRHLLNPGGSYVTTLPGPSVLFWGAVQSGARMFGRSKQARFLMVRREGADLAFLGELADAGRLRPTIGRTFPLERARDAHDASEQGHTRGKIVLEM